MTSIPIHYQKILMHVLIENTWPAIIMDDYSIRIQIVQGQYFNKSMFEFALNAGKLPFNSSMLIQLQGAYNKHWAIELHGEKSDATVTPLNPDSK